jgi:two-component system, chemotaxis family, chemotaxis protein CheY
MSEDAQMLAPVPNSEADHALLPLPQVLDLAAAERLHALMTGRLKNGGPLRIDASAVETLTYPCVQIILAAMRTYDGISIENPSTAFISAFEDLAIDWRQAQTQSPEQTETQSESPSVENIQAPPDSHDTRDAVDSPSLVGPDESAMTRRVLTIDDSKTMRDMLMLTLADAGFDVLQAVDGQDGLDVLVNERVDVVITDINMPRMDGYEVIRRLRANPDHKRTPILVLTTESEAEKRNLAREAGATGWMVKPFDPDRLVATVRKVAP